MCCEGAELRRDSQGRGLDNGTHTDGLLRRGLGDGAVARAPDVEGGEDGCDHEEGPVVTY